MIRLFSHQKKAIEQLKPGSILVGGVGSGKSLTALAYYLIKECGVEQDKSGQLDIHSLIPMMTPKDLYIITTARKRDTYEWLEECGKFHLSSDEESNIGGVKLVIDSWNNIAKYTEVENAFFIFDEQRLISYGAWSKSFLKIVKKSPVTNKFRNNWILLSATPGDVWLDYAPVFIANGFYRHITDFKRQHVIYSSYVKFPKIVGHRDVGKLVKHKNDISVIMKYKKQIERRTMVRWVGFDEEKYNKVTKERWNPYKKQPIQNKSEMFFTMRKVNNEHESRASEVLALYEHHKKVIVFYNFNYELDILRKLAQDNNIVSAEWNGHKHEVIPETDSWIYIVQYSSGAEGWNCIETNTIIFYSLNYSYRIMKQAAGRIDRLNTPFDILYYYELRSRASIDVMVTRALKNKKNFNERDYDF